MQSWNDPAASQSLGRATLVRTVVGIAIAAALLAATGASVPLTIDAVAVLALGLGLSTLVRGFELRAWFGRGMSLHQSQSLQLVLDVTRWLSPLQDRRRFEVEFIARETSRPSGRVGEWSRSRQWWRLVLLAALPTLTVTFVVPTPSLAVAGWLATLATAIVTSPHWREASNVARRAMLRSHVAMIGCALLALAIEAACIGLAARMLAPTAGLAQAGPAVVFIALGLARAVPATPFAFGLYHVLALGGLWAVNALEFTGLAMHTHLLWIVIALVPGLAYLSRYKLTLGDLFDRRLPTLIARSRRPAHGWAPDPDTAGTDIEVTVAIPAYNERERLPRYLPQVLAHLSSQPYAWEIVVADDGSQDGTADYVEAVGNVEPRVRLVRRPRNGGKGRAVLDAIEAARGRHVLIADADGATPIRELEALRTAIADGAEIAVGSRTAPRSERIRDRDAIRALIGKVFYGLVNFLAVPGIGDTQCGFKLLRRDVARALFRELGEFGWAFDVEILYRAQLAGYRVAEVAVEWHEIAGSKVRPVRDASRMLVSLFRIRARNAGFTGATGQALLAGRSAPTVGRQA